MLNAIAVAMAVAVKVAVMVPGRSPFWKLPAAQPRERNVDCSQSKEAMT